MRYCKIHPEVELKQKQGSSLYYPCWKCESKKRKAKNMELLKQSTFNNKSGNFKSKSSKSTIKTEKGVKTAPHARKKANIDNRLDTAWSKLVKLKAGMKCEVCGKIKPLNSHHIFSRAKKSVRWKTMNGICLCVGCHIGSRFSAHKTPLTFATWITKYKGEKFIQNLTIAANQSGKYHPFEKELILKELQKEIKQYE